MTENTPPKNVTTNVVKNYRTKRERRNSALMKVAQSFGTDTVTSSLEDFIKRANQDDNKPRQTWDFAAASPGAKNLADTDAALKKLRADQSKKANEKQTLATELSVAVERAKQAERRAKDAETKLKNTKILKAPVLTSQSPLESKGLPVKTIIVSAVAGGLLMFGATNLGGSKDSTASSNNKAALTTPKLQTEKVVAAPSTTVLASKKETAPQTNTVSKNSDLKAKPAQPTAKNAINAEPPKSIPTKETIKNTPKEKAETAASTTAEKRELTPRASKKVTKKPTKAKAKSAKKTKKKKPTSGIVNPF